MSLIIAIVNDDGVNANDDALIPWWSFTKTVLAAAALNLVAQARVSLDENLPKKPFTLGAIAATSRRYA
jgi:hypothetical protein